MNNTATTEDRIWAVISHLSALAFGMGILLPIIGWAEQRRKSNYASFQNLQALGYQSLGYTVWFLIYLLLVGTFFLSMLLLLSMTSEGANSFGTSMGIWMSVFIVIVFGAFVLYFLLPVIAAIACALGKDFRYPFLGNRLARYLGYNLGQKLEEQEWLIEDHEFRWVSAMGHFSVIIAVWGMLAPLTAWLTQGKQKFFLKFQSVQTLVFQALITILYFVAGFLYVLGSILLFASMGLTGTPDTSSSVGIFGLILFFVSLLIAFGVILVIPLMHILGQWAGYRVLKGDNYHYPLIGRLVEGWISKQANSTLEEKPI